jgi:AraC-like DNA-binding protein
MQQHNVNWRSLPSKSTGTVSDPTQRIIKIEQTPAYQRSQHRTDVDLGRNLEQNYGQSNAHEVMRAAIGDYRICSSHFPKGSTNDPVTERRFCARPLSASNFQLVEIDWQGGFKLEQDPLNARYLIYMVRSGSLEQKIYTPLELLCQRHQEITCSSDIATIICPGQTVESIGSDEGKALLMSIDRGSIDSAVSQLLARPLKQPVIFGSSIDLTNELGPSLEKFIQFLWESAATNSTDFSGLVLRKLEKAFLACLIEGLPSNYSDDLLYQQDGALVCHVRKAQAFIESHLHEDIKLGDIAAATSVCSRLLQKAFAHHCGCSPMRFMTQSRLQRIRQELECPTNDTKIVDVMMHYGFTQGGKFAKEYQQLFGEKPSETLKRSKKFDPEDALLWQEIDDARSDRVVGGRSIGPDQTLFPTECLSLRQYLIPFWLF